MLSDVNMLCRISNVYSGTSGSLYSIGKPFDAKWRSLGQFFLPYPHIHSRFLLSYQSYLQQAVTRGLYIDCIGTHAHGDVIVMLK